MAHPFNDTIIHLQVCLLLSYYGDTSAHPFKWLEVVLLWDTLLGHTVRGVLVKSMPPHCRQLPDYLVRGLKCQQYSTPL